MIKEVYSPPDLAVFEYCILGPLMSHNYLCAVCRERVAVINTNTGILQPCWGCQKTYKLIKLNWFDKLIGREKH